MLKPDDGTYSETKQKKMLLKNFYHQKVRSNLKNKAFINKPDEDAQVIRSAEEAIAASQEALEQSALDVQNDLKTL